MIREALLTPNEYSRPQTAMRGIDTIVLHWVENARTSADFNRAYFESLKDQPKDDPSPHLASAHYIIDDGGILRCIPETEVAYHAGPYADLTEWARERWGGWHPNFHCIGIEHCHQDWTGRFSPRVLQWSRLLCAGLCLQYDLDPAQDIIRHYDTVGKRCPKWMVDNPEELEAFRESVARTLA